MAKKRKSTASGRQKSKLDLRRDGALRITVLDPLATPYRLGSQRDRAWRVVGLMNNLTVAQAHEILRQLEPNIQGKVGRPLGWVVDAMDRGLVELRDAP